MSYHYYYRYRLGLVKCWEQQTGTYRVVILFNSSQIAQRCVFWKSWFDVCKCECVWGYEAALLFPGQLLVTQEWLICNGCCHSPAVAPGDGCTVTNAHTLTLSLRAHTTQKFKTHTHKNMCTHADALTYKESNLSLIVLRLLTRFSALVVSPASGEGKAREFGLLQLHCYSNRPDVKWHLHKC